MRQATTVDSASAVNNPDGGGAPSPCRFPLLPRARSSQTTHLGIPFLGGNTDLADYVDFDPPTVVLSADPFALALEAPRLKPRQIGY